MNPTFVKARSRLILDNPFFGTLCLRLKASEWEEPTGATDGVHLFYNAKWFEKLTEMERIGFLAHEVMHVVFLHITRREERHATKWNVACDYAINNYLVAEGFILPKGGLVDAQYDDMTAEAIYGLLPEPDKGWDNVAVDLGKCGGVMDHPGTDGTAGKTGAIEAGLTVAIHQAAESAKAQGKLSADLESLITDITDPKVDWKAVLARFLRSNNKSDFTWVRPNRRFIGSGLYLPSLHNPCLEEIVIAVDTSGSISDDELKQFTTETSYILHELAPERVQFIQCDAEINDVTEYTRESLPLKVTYKGRGGTEFTPVIDYVNENHPNAAALVYLTDLECGDFGDQPHYPVLWVTTQDHNAPYGEVIHMQ
jgi:predicted metal-dependent peptidase